MSENPDPRKPPRVFERKALLIALLVLAVLTVSYFLMHSVDTQQASDETHGEPHAAREEVPVAPIEQE